MTEPVPNIYARISNTTIDPAELESFVMDATRGALVTFRGVVRDHDHSVAVTALDYRAHPDAERFLRDCCQSISDQTGLRVAAVHRIGSLAVGDVALVASVAAAHRAEAFAACGALVDAIKQTVPIWKRQHLADGVTEWVGL